MNYVDQLLYLEKQQHKGSKDEISGDEISKTLRRHSKDNIRIQGGEMPASSQQQALFYHNHVYLFHWYCPSYPNNLQGSLFTLGNWSFFQQKNFSYLVAFIFIAICHNHGTLLTNKNLLPKHRHLSIHKKGTGITYSYFILKSRILCYHMLNPAQRGYLK